MSAYSVKGSGQNRGSREMLRKRKINRRGGEGRREEKRKGIKKKQKVII